jgi:hypothetical protein
MGPCQTVAMHLRRNGVDELNVAASVFDVLRLLQMYGRVRQVRQEKRTSNGTSNITIGSFRIFPSGASRRHCTVREHAGPKVMDE